MTADWVAVTTRGRALSSRRLGRLRLRELAQSPSLDAALATLVRTPYGRDVRQTMSLAQAERAVYATLLWHLRILAGWAPPLGAERIRALAAGFEISNITDKLATLQGLHTSTPFALGALATDWSHIEPARSPDELRHALATCAWGDPGSTDIGIVRLSLQTAWARRVSEESPEARPWAITFVLLLLARTIANAVLLSSETSPGRNLRVLLGGECAAATSLAQLVARAPRSAAWLFAGVKTREELWHAEMRWWDRLESEGLLLSSSAQPRPQTIVGLVGLLSADAWRTRAALEIAARGDVANAQMIEGTNAVA